jgi:hypothetical protein
MLLVRVRGDFPRPIEGREALIAPRILLFLKAQLDDLNRSRW